VSSATPERWANCEWQFAVAQLGWMMSGEMKDHFFGRVSALEPHPTTASANTRAPPSRRDV
jgi:hypothetical protein